MIDVFGNDVHFSDETETHVTVSARVVDEAMFHFAKRFAPDVIVLEPASLVEKLRKDAETVLAVYEDISKEGK